MTLLPAHLNLARAAAALVVAAICTQPHFAAHASDATTAETVTQAAPAAGVAARTTVPALPGSQSRLTIRQETHVVREPSEYGGTIALLRAGDEVEIVTSDEKMPHGWLRVRVRDWLGNPAPGYMRVPPDPDARAPLPLAALSARRLIGIGAGYVVSSHARRTIRGAGTVPELDIGRVEGFGRCVEGFWEGRLGGDWKLRLGLGFMQTEHAGIAMTRDDSQRPYRFRARRELITASTLFVYRLSDGGWLGAGVGGEHTRQAVFSLDGVPDPSSGAGATRGVVRLGFGFDLPIGPSGALSFAALGTTAAAARAPDEITLGWMLGFSRLF